MVVDALSRKERLNMAAVSKELSGKIRRFELELCVCGKAEEICRTMTFQPSLLEKIKKSQEEVMNRRIIN